MYVVEKQGRHQQPKWIETPPLSLVQLHKSVSREDPPWPKEPPCIFACIDRSLLIYNLGIGHRRRFISAKVCMRLAPSARRRLSTVVSPFSALSQRRVQCQSSEECCVLGIFSLIQICPLQLHFMAEAVVCTRSIGN